MDTLPITKLRLVDAKDCVKRLERVRLEGNTTVEEMSNDIVQCLELEYAPTIRSAQNMEIAISCISFSILVIRELSLEYKWHDDFTSLAIMKAEVYLGKAMKERFEK